jgi:hypothetical protein
MFWPNMAAANASPRGQRTAIRARKLGDLTGFCLVVDCLGPACQRERTLAISELAEFYGPGSHGLRSAAHYAVL